MNLISEVKAQEAASPVAKSEFSFASFVPLILIFVIFYFLIIRPQSKKMKEHQRLVNSIKKGDKVVTNSGIIGVVNSIDEKENIVKLEIAQDTQIEIIRGHITEIFSDKKKNDNKLKAKTNKSKK